MVLQILYIHTWLWFVCLQDMNAPSSIGDAECESDEGGGDLLVSIESDSVLRVLGERTTEADVSNHVCCMAD